jgi:hypothetical protein
MPPTTSRNFHDAAAQRLAAAEVLRSQRINLDAQYLAGYAVEFSLKAPILDLTPAPDRPGMLKKFRGANWHSKEVLTAELRRLGARFPLEITRRLRRFDWAVELRYETGRRDTGETIAVLKTAKAVHDWVGSQLP